MSLPKPVLRGLLRNHLRREIAIASVLSVVGAIAYKYSIAEPRKKVYEEFYKTYDASAHFERIRKRGLLQSFPAD